MRVNLIGTGNVAWHMAHAFQQAGVEVVAVAGRALEPLHTLASSVHAQPVSWPATLPEADVNILAVSDRAVAQVAQQLPEDILVVHTSGSVPLQDMGPGRRGVFYPLQTFSKTAAVDFIGIPLCVEAAQAQDLATLEALGAALGMDVRSISSAQRATLHLAAVFACNFPNALYETASRILQTGGMELDLLYPLMRETTEKAVSQAPLDAQTGPARRGDHPVLETHLRALQGHPELATLYQQLSELIRNRYHGPEL